MTKAFINLPYVFIFLILAFAFGAHRYFGPDPAGQASRPPDSVHADQDAWSEQCKSESPQSPVSLKSDQFVGLTTLDVRIELNPASVSLVDTGYTFSIDYGSGQSGGVAKIDGDSFRIRRIEFHKPSEHLLDGRQLAMEANLIFENEDKGSSNRALSVNLLVNEGKHNAELQSAWRHLPPMREGHGESSSGTNEPLIDENKLKETASHPKVLAENIKFDASKLLKNQLKFIAYLGSSTDPQCTPGFVHLTSLTPIEFDHYQIEHFEGYYEGNNRDIQKIGDSAIRNFRSGTLK